MQTETLTVSKTEKKWRILQLLCLILILFSGSATAAEDKPVPVSYDLNVSIEPAEGTVAVHGEISVRGDPRFSRVCNYCPG